MKRLHPLTRAVYLLGLPGGAYLAAMAVLATAGEQPPRLSGPTGYTVLASVFCFVLSAVHVLLRKS